MLTKLTIGQFVASQKERLASLDTGLARRIPDLSSLTTHASTTTGTQTNTAKSTLLQQINRTSGERTLYLNFEDPRLAGFDISDFNPFPGAD